MVSKRLLRPILGNDSITRGLADPEARVLIEWLVKEAERAAEPWRSTEEVTAAVEKLCRRARAISRFVYLWGLPRERGAAYQLAAIERFAWPLPTTEVDPCELMLDILAYEATAA
jgi:hypothetical protein